MTTHNKTNKNPLKVGFALHKEGEAITNMSKRSQVHGASSRLRGFLRVILAQFVGSSGRNVPQPLARRRPGLKVVALAGSYGLYTLAARDFASFRLDCCAGDEGKNSGRNVIKRK